MIQIIVPFLSLLVLQPSPTLSQSYMTQMAIPAHEDLEYNISWERVLRVGTGKITLKRTKDSYLLEMSAKSARFFDLFFKVRDQFRSIVPLDFSSFKLYEKRIREGRYRRHDYVTYDPLHGVVTYRKNGDPMPDLSVSPPVFDPFSILFAYRFTCPKDSNCTLVATDGKHIDEVEVRLIKREEITVKAGTFSTIKVQPVWRRMQGVFRKKKGGHIYIWFEERPPYRPIKMEAEIFIGKIVAELSVSS